MPLKQGWHPAQIVAAVRMKGSNLAQLGLANGKADSTLRAALLKPRRPSNKIIADFIGVPLHELWPAWFDVNGALIGSRSDGARARRYPSSPTRDAA